MLKYRTRKVDLWSLKACKLDGGLDARTLQGILIQCHTVVVQTAVEFRSACNYCTGSS